MQDADSLNSPCYEVGVPDTELEPVEFGGTLPPLYSALLIELVLNGALEPEHLDSIAIRLEADDMPNAAASVRALMLSVAVEAEFLLSKMDDEDEPPET